MYSAPQLVGATRVSLVAMESLTGKGGRSGLLHSQILHSQPQSIPQPHRTQRQTASSRRPCRRQLVPTLPPTHPELAVERRRGALCGTRGGALEARGREKRGIPGAAGAVTGSQRGQRELWGGHLAPIFLWAGGQFVAQFRHCKQTQLRDRALRSDRVREGAGTAPDRFARRSLV